MFKAFNLKRFLTSIIIPVGTGLIAALLTRNSMDIYGRINTPPLSPPSVLFPIVWTILYILMGISLYIFRGTSVPDEVKRKGHVYFGLQLLFNFLWSIAFFNLSLYTFAAIWLVALIVLIVLNILQFKKADNLSAYLLIPYLIWCCFALYLNIGIAILN